MFFKKIKKFLSVLSISALILGQGWFPIASLAQEASPQPLEIINSPTPEPEPSLVEPSLTPSVQITPENLATPTPTPGPTPTPSPTPSPDETGSAELTPNPGPSPTPIPLEETSTWTINDGLATTSQPVVLNETYTAPQNDKVKITFTRLPPNPGTISIKEVKLSETQKEELNALSDIAYEITSPMENNTFEYTLTLPTPTTEGVEVKSSEDGENFTTLGGVTPQQDSLTITGLTHFTLFVVTTVVDFESGVSTDTTINDVGGGDGDVENTLGAATTDQSQPTGSTAQIFDNAIWLTQTFTAGQTGFLTRVSLSLRRANNTNGQVTVEIRNTVAGAPGGTVLATRSRPATALSTSQTNVNFNFASPPEVSSGTTYAIVIYRSGAGNLTADYTWFRAVATSNQYAAGEGYRSSDSGANWALRNSGRGDHRFTTFVRSYGALGMQTSDVLNAGFPLTSFFELSWSETLPSDTDITFEARASSTPFDKDAADPSWVELDGEDSPIDLSAFLPDTYQYFQWRATLSGTETATPTLHEVTATYLSPPSATPSGGDYFSDQTISLSAEAGTTIRYTTDGTTPTSSEGTLYTDPILIGIDTTLKAVAVDADGNASSVLTEIYSIAPIISDEASSAVTSSSATITWTTDDPSTSRVIYDTVSHPVLGTAPNYGYASSTVEDPTKVTSHSASVSGLVASTTYFYRTISHGSPETVGSEKTITTAALAAASTSGDGGGGGGGGGGDGGDGLGCAVHDCSGVNPALQNLVLGVSAPAPAAGFAPGVLGITSDQGNVGVGENGQVKGEATASAQEVSSPTSGPQTVQGSAPFNFKVIAIIVILLLGGFGVFRFFIK